MRGLARYSAGNIGTATPWYLEGGISASDVAGAWQAIGAASLAASYLRLAGDQGYANIDPAIVGSGVAPTWGAATGWTFNGSTQYLNTGIIPAANWSMLVRFSNTENTTTRMMCGISESGQRFYLAPTLINGVFVYGIGNTAIQVAPEALSGVFGFSGLQGYRNGVADGAASAGYGGAFSLSIILGAQHDSSVPSPYISRFVQSEMQAFVAYKTTITAAQVLAVSTAMAAL